MRSLAVVEVQIPADRGARLAEAVAGVPVDLLVFDRAPEPLEENVVAPGALGVPAEGDGVVLQQAGELGAGELTALVGGENLRLAVLGERLLDGLEAELDLPSAGGRAPRSPSASSVSGHGDGRSPPLRRAAGRAASPPDRSAILAAAGSRGGSGSEPAAPPAVPVQAQAPGDHRFALSRSALPSAPDKKSFSRVSAPSFACSVFTSTDAAGDDPEPNTSAAPSRSCAFHPVIWFGCTSNRCESSDSVLSPLSAA